ncbi:MAG: NAD(P)/FAD-dependent oxidoreductase [Rhizobiales bacterium]|nr:NAD(P)/FAD-dependent oxidoreductase [Hyphomicrobiales bacterium]
MARLSDALDVAIIGAGPYGLSLAAHLRARGIEHRIFGDPMGPWKSNMPPGMLLKSYPWASNLSDPESRFTTKNFCVERALPYHDELIPLPLERFVEYGEAFQVRYVPNVERKMLMALEPGPAGFHASFNDGETLHARRVVIAVGLSSFRRMPPEAAHLPTDLYSHSAAYGPTGSLRGKNVVVVGAGSSATDLAALLSEQGISVSLVARAAHLDFACRPRTRSLFERVTAPMSGIGNGWNMALCAKYPTLIRLLRQDSRIQLANSKAHGPLGGAFMKDRVIGKVPLALGYRLEGAETRNGQVMLNLVDINHSRQSLRADHVVFATGYSIDIARLGFLDGTLAQRIGRIAQAPRLSAHYESSVPGLYFIGPVAANSFGPVSRFVYGAYHPAQNLARHLSAILPRARSATKLQPVESTVLS